MPISWPKGSSQPAINANTLVSAKKLLASIQVRAPAGAAIIMARQSTNKVLSNRERMRIWPSCGFRKGGSSKTKKKDPS